MSLDVSLSALRQTCVFDSNITHNLGKMADKVGIYYHLWRPDEIGIHKAEQLIEPLERGLKFLLDDPDRFRAFDPANGWGDYDGLVRFVDGYLTACRENPDADVRANR